jgi:hypothetical protein
MPTIEGFAWLPRLARFVEPELPLTLPIRDCGSIEREIEYTWQDRFNGDRTKPLRKLLVTPSGGTVIAATHLQTAR